MSTGYRILFCEDECEYEVYESKPYTKTCKSSKGIVNEFHFIKEFKTLEQAKEFVDAELNSEYENNKKLFTNKAYSNNQYNKYEMLQSRIS